jgi:hypothetical protein
MSESQHEDPAGRKDRRGALLTAALWVVGIGLQFAAPLLRDRVPLSDDLFIGSFLYPWWLFAQVAVLAGILALFRRASDRWSPSVRTAFAVVAALVMALPQPDLITQLIDTVPLGDNPLRVALLWSTPLAFYLVPATLVVVAWLWRDARLSLMRALGLGLVVIGVLNFPYILWLTHLWEIYVRSTGGGSVHAPGGSWPIG